jgi:hypothetical protein
VPINFYPWPDTGSFFKEALAATEGRQNGVEQQKGIKAFNLHEMAFKSHFWKS